ncbi:MAG: serine/threonine-protein kinase [Verrucomicrobia bacterium]|nr:serine/threonine-protein kinase [Verrucomicrobiota bacterium]
MTSIVSIDDFTEISQLGEGGYATVYLMKHNSTKRQYAVKVISQNKYQDLKYIAEEIAVSLILNHPNILKTELTFHDENKHYIVMEYFKGVDLFARIKEKYFTDNKPALKHVIKQLLSVLDYCHNIRICHRDIKPENILINEDNSIRLIDWGYARKDEMLNKDIVGTLEYLTPQMIKGHQYDCTKVDIYQVGILTYELSVGHTPFIGTNLSDAEIMKAIEKSDIEFPADFDTSVKDFILELTTKDETKRPTAKEALKMKWLQ